MAETDFIPFALPDVGEGEAEAVANTILSGWVTSGKEMEAFEQEFADFIGHDVAGIAVNSATAGLHLALEAVGVGPGDEVIVPTWTFTATAEVVRYLGATPVIVDVEGPTLNISPAAVAQAVSARTKAVIPVHLGGLAVDLVAIREALGSHQISIIEDAAHALPTYGPQGLVGSCSDSDATVFSFYATKTLTTGEGGMITTRNRDLAARVRVMRLHGIDRPAFDRYTSTSPSWRYDVVAPGFKYNMPDTAAAMGRVQLSRVQTMALRRREIAAYYMSNLSDLPLHLPALPRPGETHSWHLFIIRLDETCPHNRDDLITSLAREGIGTSVHYIPLHEHTYWRSYVTSPQSTLPVATAFSPRALSLPIYSRMSDSQVERVVQSVRKTLT